MSEALAKCRDYDVVLIDTAGRSQRDDGKLDQLAAFIAAANPHEVHLVLSSTANEHVLLEAAERFTKMRIDHIIFTKLDEAVSFGVLLNVVRKVNKQLSYITTGQEVPHQIEPGRSERLAGLILGEGI
jgi:flagellar biosynthesis protein FlhF